MAKLTTFIKHNAGLKAMALVLAVLSFYAIRGATSNERTLEVPVEARVEKGVAILSQMPMTVEVTFRGTEEDVERLDKEELKAVIHPKASNPDQPEEIIKILPGDIEGSSRVRVTTINPNSVSLSFDRERSKLVAVRKPATTGTPLRGKVEISYEPQFVMIHGSQRGLREVDSVDTEAVDVDGRVQSFKKRVKILPPADTWVSKIEPDEVSVSVDLVTRVVDRVWSNVPVMTVLAPGKPSLVDISPRIVHVTLQARAEILDTLHTNDISVFVDCVGINPGITNRLTPVIYLPAGLDITATAEPKQVAVSFMSKAGNNDGAR
ncbi:MAG: YbbR-like domain-containing protein [Kiritimatiellae bacterium]|nr:YbbR-like domain-containing protein [Kiritimatiellia bacterium]